MESNIKFNSPLPEVLPIPETKPEVEPTIQPDENDPWSVPNPKISPTPKA